MGLIDIKKKPANGIIAPIRGSSSLLMSSACRFSIPTKPMQKVLFAARKQPLEIVPFLCKWRSVKGVVHRLWSVQDRETSVNLSSPLYVHGNSFYNDHLRMV